MNQTNDPDQLKLIN